MATIQLQFYYSEIVHSGEEGLGVCSESRKNSPTENMNQSKQTECGAEL